MIGFTDIDFLILGATKSATTWLQRSLQADPSVVMPVSREAYLAQSEDALELHYFSREYERGAEWYLDHFTPTEETRLIGEKSNSYLEVEVAADRIVQHLPHARLIAQLRNPVERAYSDYCMLFRRGSVGRDIDRELDPAQASSNRFLEGGRYHHMLRRYFDRFPQEQILVTLYDRVASDPVGLLEDVRGFLGLPPGLARNFVQKKVKDKSSPMLSPGLRKLLKPLKPIVRPLRATTAFRALHGLVAREIQYEPLNDRLHDRLVDYFAPDVEALSAMIGRDLTGWLTETARHDSDRG